MVTKVLMRLDITEDKTFYRNRNIMVIQNITVRLIGLLILLAEANWDKCEKYLFKIKPLILIGKQTRI